MAQRNDIEDVLSSIRRLVANEAAPVIEAQAAHALVLDQAQRVTEPEDPFQTVQGLPEPALDATDPDDTPELPEAPNAVEPADRAPLLSLSEPEPERDFAEPETDETDPDPVADPAPLDPARLDLSDLSSSLDSDEALRDLIAEIVRQELAGALGERITRNVRKLVRRELRLIMSGEEFD